MDEIMKRFHKDENTNSEANKQNSSILNGSIISEQITIEQQQTDQQK